MNKPDAAYIATAACGHVRGAIVDEPEHVKDTSKFVAVCIKQGFTISSVSVEEARAANWGGCDRCKPPKRGKK